MTDLSHDAPDDGFHEIQLSGKQLVFLFMATTVVSVVIFLCGVLVGRGVRGEPLSADGAAAPISTGGAGVSAATPVTPPPPIVDGAAPTSAGLSYSGRLSSEKPVEEAIKEPSKAPAQVAAAQVVAAPPAATEPAQAKPVQAKPETESKAGAGEPQAGVWAVQVVALTDRAAALAVVGRLKGKGYQAFLVQPPSGAVMQNYRYKVQVGRFEDRLEAEVVAGRLKKEEQFQPWILR